MSATAHNLFSRWRYSARILYSGCDRSTYQQDVVVHRSVGTDYEEESGGLKIWHIYVGPNCREDYGDVRFTNSTGAELEYYLWPDYDNESARLCVRLEGADADGTLTVHFGNPSAGATSDGDATFQFFDDFDTGAALNTDKWTSERPISDGTLTVNYPTLVHTQQDFAYPIIVQARGRAISTGSSGATPVGLKSLTSWKYRAGTLSVSSSGYYYFRSTNEGASEDTLAYLSPTTDFRIFTIDWQGATAGIAIDGVHYGYNSKKVYSSPQRLAIFGGNVNGGVEVDWVLVRAYSATPPSLLRTSRGVNLSYAGLSRLPLDDVIRFAGAGKIQVLDDEIYSVAGAGGFSIETSVRSAIQVAGAGALSETINLMPGSAEIGGTGAAVAEPVHFRTPIVAEGGEGSAYVAPAAIKFDISKYNFESLSISRSAQDALWKCDGKIDGLDAPLAYKNFEVKVPDHLGTLHTIFFGFVPGRDYVQAVAADKSIVQGYDAGFYLTRQYLPEGDLTYPARLNWPPDNMIKYWLGEETNQAGSLSKWERVSGVMPYRIYNPGLNGHSYTPKDWALQPKTTKMQAIQEVCEYSDMVFLVKWREINGALTPCAYFVYSDWIDDPDSGLDLPPIAEFTAPDPCIADEVRVTLRSDERYNRIIVRVFEPDGVVREAIRETSALQCGDELPIEYLEERSDLSSTVDEGAWCSARADELYDYYTKYAYTYSLTLIDRTDLELYQRCRFYGIASIPDGETMRIVSIRYIIKPTHTEVAITVTPDTRLSDLRRLQRSQSADTVSEMQTIAQSQIDQVARGEVGTVVSVDGSEATIEMERGTDMVGRIV